MRIKDLLRTVIAPILGCSGNTDCILRSSCPESSCTENDLCGDCRIHLERHVDHLITEAAYSDEATLAAAIAASVHERGIVEDEVIGAMRTRQESVRVRHEDAAWLEQHAPTPTPCAGGKTFFLDEDGQPI